MPDTIHRSSFGEMVHCIASKPVARQLDCSLIQSMGGSVKLETGDLVIAFTDGLIEAASQDGEEWGVQGLLKAATRGTQCSQEARNLVNLIFHSMDDFSNEHQTDDATLAVMRVI